MFGSAGKAQAAVKEFMQTPEFQGVLSENMIPLLSRSEITIAIGNKLDEFLSSTIVLHKVHKQIDESLAGLGKKFIEENLPTIFTHPDLRSAVTAQTAVAMKQVMERTSQQAVVNHLAGHEAKKFIHENLMAAVATAFDHSDILNQIIRRLESVAKEHTYEILEQQIKRQVASTDIRESVQALVDQIVDDNVRATFPKLVKFERQDGSLSKIQLVHRKFDDVLKACSVPGANILLVGPAGSGKTQIAIDVATALNRQFYFNGPVQSEYKLLGFRDATGEYRPTPFYNAYTGGGVYLFDEIDASSPQALVAFNTAIANRYCDFPVSGVPVRASDDFVCLAAANTFGRGANHDYVGRNQLDAATLDRFIVIEIDYDENMERLAATDTEWVEKVQKWRQRARALNVRHVISMRASIAGSHLLKSFSEQEVEDMVVWRGLDRNTVAKIKTG